MPDSAVAKIRKGKEPMLRNTLKSAEEAPEIRAQAVQQFQEKNPKVAEARSRLEEVVADIRAKGGGILSRLWKTGKNR
jgi:predicted nucleotide-binding protein (sugar kinase/HSP70/actin superfamily)